MQQRYAPFERADMVSSGWASGSLIHCCRCAGNTSVHCMSNFASRLSSVMPMRSAARKRALNYCSWQRGRALCIAHLGSDHQKPVFAHSLSADKGSHGQRIAFACTHPQRFFPHAQHHLSLPRRFRRGPPSASISFSASLKARMECVGGVNRNCPLFSNPCH